MGVIREELTLVDRFTAPFKQFIQLGRQSADTATYAGRNITSMSEVSKQRIGVLSESMRKQTAETQRLQAEYQKISNQANASKRTLASLEAQISRSEAQEYKYGKAIAKTQVELQRAEMQERANIASLQKKQKAVEAAENSLKNNNSTLDKSIKLMGMFYAIQKGAEFLQNITDAADQQSQLNARINQMNDGLQTSADLQKMIYDSAQRSRGSYTATANMVGKFGTLAPDAFGSSAEIVSFAEQINKHLTLSGTSQSGADATILQLTQAMGAGVLRGEELNTILEQTPTLAQSIAKYMGMNVGEMRKLAAEGAVTADVVKNALFDTAKKTNEQFAKMPMTWAQLWQSGMNAIQRMAQPVLSRISQGATWLRDNWTEFIPVLAGVAAGFTAMGIASVMANSASIASSMAALAPYLALGAAVATMIYVLHISGVSWQEMGAVAGAVLGGLYAVGYNTVAGLWNNFASFAEFLANVWDDPLGSTVRLFAGTFDALLGMIENVASAIDALLGSDLSGAVSGFRGNLSSWVTDNFGESAIQIKRMANIDVGDTASSFGNAGSSLGAKLDNMNFSLGDIAKSMSGFDASSIPSYSDMNIDKVGSVGSVKSVEGDIRLSDEDLKMYRDLAERKYMNQVQVRTLAPNIQVSVAPGQDGKLSPKDIADAVRRVIIEESEAETDLAYE